VEFYSIFFFIFIGLLFLLIGILAGKYAQFYKKNGRKIECFVTDFEIGSAPYYGQYTPQDTIPKYIVTLKIPDSDDIIVVESVNRKAKRYSDVKFAEIYYIDDPNIIEKAQLRDKTVTAGKFTFDLSGKGSIIASAVIAGVFFAAGIFFFVYFSAH
jgi:hypothetical protein